MSEITLRRWDSAEHLKTEAEIAAYFDAVLEEGDPALVRHALGVVARARGMSQLAHDTGLTRESLDGALSPDGNPAFATVMKVITVLGLRLRVESAAPVPQAGRGIRPVRNV